MDVLYPGPRPGTHHSRQSQRRGQRLVACRMDHASAVPRETLADLWEKLCKVLEPMTSPRSTLEASRSSIRSRAGGWPHAVTICHGTVLGDTATVTLKARGLLTLSLPQILSEQHCDAAALAMLPDCALRKTPQFAHDAFAGQSREFFLFLRGSGNGPCTSG